MIYYLHKLMKPLAIVFVVYASSCCSFKFKDVKCEALNTELAVVSVCNIKAISRTVNEVNVVYTLKQPWRDIQVNVQTFKKANGFKPWLYNISIDGCDYLKHRNNPLLNYLFRFLDGYTNVNHSCPYYNELVLKKWRVDDRQVTLPVPEGEYMLLANVVANGKLSATVRGSMVWT